MVKTPPSQGGVTGSIPVRVILLGYRQIGKAVDSESIMSRFDPEYPNLGHTSLITHTFMCGLFFLHKKKKPGNGLLQLANYS